MEDTAIIDLYWARSQQAIAESEKNTAHTAPPLPGAFWSGRRTQRNALTMHILEHGMQSPMKDLAFFCISVQNCPKFISKTL